MARAAATARLGAGLSSVLDLPARIAELDGDARARADRLLEVSVVHGRTDPSAELEPWLATQFGSAEAVREQTIVKVTNLVTLEATLFAPLRSRRPVDGPGRPADLASEIAATDGDPFCNPETGTPAHAVGSVGRAWSPAQTPHWPMPTTP